MNKRLLAALAIITGATALAACTRSEAPPAPALAVPAAAAPAAAAAVGEPSVVAGAVPAPAAPLPPAPAAPGGAPVPAGMLAVHGFGAPAPASWTPAPTSSSMRFAQFVVPGANGDADGEVAAFFFQAGNGGTQEMNIERWTSHFTGPGGQPATPEVTVTSHGQTKVTLVELKGNYARGVGMGSEGEAAKPNQTLLVAMVEIPAGRITLQIYGPNQTVAAQRDNFLKVARGFKPV